MTTPRSFHCHITSAATLSDAVDIGELATIVRLEIPTITSSSVYIQGSAEGTTYRRIYKTIENGAGAIVNVPVSFDSTVSQAWVEIPTGYRYLKVELTSGISDATSTWNIVCTGIYT